MPRHKVLETCNDIFLHIGICALVDGEAGRGMGVEEKTETAGDSAGFQDIFDICCNVNHFHVGCRPDFDFALAHGRLPGCGRQD